MVLKGMGIKMKNRYTKTIFVMLTGICLVLNSAFVFAEGDGLQSSPANQNITGVRAQNIQQKVQAAKGWSQELKPLFDQVRTNRLEILKVKNELLSLQGEARAKVRELREQKDSLTDEQLQQLKEVLKVFKADKGELKAMIGKIHVQTLELRIEKREKDVDQGKDCLNAIIALQKQKIDALIKSVADLKNFINS